MTSPLETPSANAPSFQYFSQIQTGVKIVAALVILASIGIAVAAGMEWLPSFALYTSIATAVVSAVLLGVLLYCTQRPSGLRNQGEGQIEHPELGNQGEGQTENLEPIRPPTTFNLPPSRQTLEALLVPFYRGEGRNSEGVSLEEMLAFTDEQLQESLQNRNGAFEWLFPRFYYREERRIDDENGSGSGFVRVSVLDDGLTVEMRRQPVVIQNMRRAFLRMLQFYGLQFRDEFPRGVVRAENYDQRRPVWLTLENPYCYVNARIIESLTAMGLYAEARDFYFFFYRLTGEERNLIGDQGMTLLRVAAIEALLLRGS